MRHQYRIEYPSRGKNAGEILSLPVPDIPTALVVAQINLPGGSAQLWDGKKQLATIQRQIGGDTPFWFVSRT